MSLIKKIAWCNSELCPDCKIVPTVSKNFEKFNDVQICSIHKELFLKAEQVSQDDCEHEFDPDEGYHCLNCGLDGSEQVMSAAHDRAKDLRKYGDT